MRRFSVKIFIVPCKQQETGDENHQATRIHVASFTPKETPPASNAKVTEARRKRGWGGGLMLLAFSHYIAPA